MPSSAISTARPVRVLVVGLGTMGTSHARAYGAIDGFELAGLCTSRAAERTEAIEDRSSTGRDSDTTCALRLTSAATVADPMAPVAPVTTTVGMI